MDHYPEEWEKPKWQKRLEAKGREMVDRNIPVEKDTLYQFMALMFVHKDDPIAVDRAVHDLNCYYRQQMFPEWSDEYLNMHDKGVSYFHGAICDHVFDFAQEFKWDSAQNKRCSELIIKLRDNAKENMKIYNKKDPIPVLGWDSRNLFFHAGEQWRKWSPAYNAELEDCTKAINQQAFMARLLAGGLFKPGYPLVEGQHDAFCLALKAVREGLLYEPDTWDILRVQGCRGVIAAHYILLVPTEIHSTLLAHPIEPLENTDTVPPRIRGAMRAELGTRRTQDSRERVRWELQQWLRNLEHHVLMWENRGEGEEDEPHEGYGLAEWDMTRCCQDAMVVVRGWLDRMEEERALRLVAAGVAPQEAAAADRREVEWEALRRAVGNITFWREMWD